MRYSLPLLLLLTLLLSACSTASAAISPMPTSDNAATLLAIVSSTLSAPTATAPATSAVGAAVTPAPSAAPGVVTGSKSLSASEDLTRTDSEGAVEVDVTPSNLSNPGSTLDFEVALNTHSVNLNMDLTKLATLKTDTGFLVNASSWNGERGGHHVSGTLSFPAEVDGKAVLTGTKALTLMIQNVDAPERIFTWELTP